MASNCIPIRITKAVNAHVERCANRSPPMTWPEPVRGMRMSMVLGPDGLGHPTFSEPEWSSPKLPKVSRYQMFDECHYLIQKLTEARTKAGNEVTYVESKGWADLAMENRFLFVQYDIAAERTQEIAFEFNDAKYDHCPELIRKFYRECLHPEKFDLINLTEGINKRMELWVKGLARELTIAFNAINSEGARAEGVAIDWLQRSPEDRDRLRKLVFWDESAFPVKLLSEVCSCGKNFIHRQPDYNRPVYHLIRCTQCLSVFSYGTSLGDRALNLSFQQRPTFTAYNGE